jgi:hypothetical protein
MENYVNCNIIVSIIQYVPKEKYSLLFSRFVTEPVYLKDDDLPREGELREQDRFLPIFNISKVTELLVTDPNPALDLYSVLEL